MKAAFIAIGTELLGTERLDTNSLRITAALERFGVELARKSVIGDDEAEISRELRTMISRFDLVVVSGGLGPTADDLTRDAVAGALGREQRFEEEILHDIERKFASIGRRMPEINRRQAWVIDGAEIIPNPRGTAPGMVLKAGDAAIFLLPGVPGELRGMVNSKLIPWLSERRPGVRSETRALLVACLAESEVEERIAPAYEEFGREAISILARPGEIRLHFRATGEDGERRERLDAMERRLAGLVGKAVFGRRDDDTLEAVVGNLLRHAGMSLATAESCTGGLLGSRLTAVPGSSDYFPGGVVAYSNRIKESLAGVPAKLLETHGAVSEKVARALAEGVREKIGADFGVGITGVAGPGGGSEEKPVGTVHIAVAGPRVGAGKEGVKTTHRCVRFPGDRERIRRQSTQLALEILRRRLLDAETADGGEGG